MYNLLLHALVLFTYTSIHTNAFSCIYVDIWLCGWLCDKNDFLLQCQQVVQYMHKNLHGWRCRWIKLLDVDESVRFITFLKYSHHLSIFLSLLFAKNLNLHTQDKTWVAKFRRWPYDKLVMYFHVAVALIINF